MGKPRPLDLSTTREVRDSCLCLHVQRAARAVARRYDDRLRPVGLSNGQFSLLMALNRAEPPPLSQVAGLLAMDRTTLTANLKPLARRGLLLVQVDEHDRRSRLLVLTNEGRALLARALPLWKRAQTENLQYLGKPSSERLLAELSALS